MKAITVELPDDLLPRFHESPEAIGRELRLAAAIRWLRLGRLTPDEAADLAGLGRAEFDAALAEGAPTSTPGPPGRPFKPEEAEEHYRVLGAWKGPAAAEDLQRAAQEFWRTSSVAGARWLVGRLRDEVIVERLHWAGSVLADLGRMSLGPILEALQGHPSPDQALALLRALAWIGEREKADQAIVELVLVRYLLDEDPDLREAACAATRLLPQERARFWLSRRLRDETDAEARRTIEEELGLAPGVEGPASCTS